MIDLPEIPLTGDLDLSPDTVADLTEGPLRGAREITDPDLVRLQERFVILREGLRGATRAAMEEREMRWVAAFLRADHLLGSAQSLIEDLR